MSNERSWESYLSETGLKHRMFDGDIILQLPEIDWTWEHLGEDNQQKFQARRAAQLQLFPYFLTDPDNFNSGVKFDKLLALDSAPQRNQEQEFLKNVPKTNPK